MKRIHVAVGITFVIFLSCIAGQSMNTPLFIHSLMTSCLIVWPLFSDSIFQVSQAKGNLQMPPFLSAYICTVYFALTLNGMCKNIGNYSAQYIKVHAECLGRMREHLTKSGVVREAAKSQNLSWQYGRTPLGPHARCEEQQDGGIEKDQCVPARAKAMEI